MKKSQQRTDIPEMSGNRMAVETKASCIGQIKKLRVNEEPSATIERH
ncbi:MAG: hypothetical protein K6E73_08215 [Bacteroidales bacterium]|nr:hypothetical protein [Bacteroidales bacterium]